jgi:predicted translin family RNA/ssDNA-binding protein
MKYTYLLISFILVLFLYNSVKIVENMDNNIENNVYKNQAAIINFRKKLKGVKDKTDTVKKIIDENGDYINKNIK